MRNGPLTRSPVPMLDPPGGLLAGAAAQASGSYVCILESWAPGISQAGQEAVQVGEPGAPVPPGPCPACSLGLCTSLCSVERERQVTESGSCSRGSTVLGGRGWSFSQAQHRQQAWWPCREFSSGQREAWRGIRSNLDRVLRCPEVPPPRLCFPL